MRFACGKAHIPSELVLTIKRKRSYTCYMSDNCTLSVGANSTEKQWRSRSCKRNYPVIVEGVMRRDFRKMLFLTFTTPPEFSGSLNHAWRLWRLRMKRRGYDFDYCLVKEYNSKRDLVHIHCIADTEYLDYNVAREQWKAVTGAVWFHGEKTYLKSRRRAKRDGAKGLANYLAKYMFKQDGMKGRRLWYSKGWLGVNWRKFTRALYILGMNNEQRKSDVDCCFYTRRDINATKYFQINEVFYAWERLYENGMFPLGKTKYKEIDCLYDDGYNYRSVERYYHKFWWEQFRNNNKLIDICGVFWRWIPTKQEQKVKV